MVCLAGCDDKRVQIETTDIAIERVEIAWQSLLQDKNHTIRILLKNNSALILDGEVDFQITLNQSKFITSEIRNLFEHTSAETELELVASLKEDSKNEELSPMHQVFMKFLNNPTDTKYGEYISVDVPNEEEFYSLNVSSAIYLKPGHTTRVELELIVPSDRALRKYTTKVVGFHPKR